MSSDENKISIHTNWVLLSMSVHEWHGLVSRVFTDHDSLCTFLISYGFIYRVLINLLADKKQSI